MTKEDAGDIMLMDHHQQQKNNDNSTAATSHHVPQQQHDNVVVQRRPVMHATSSCDVEGGVPTAVVSSRSSGSDRDDSQNHEEEPLNPLSTTEHLGKHRQYWRDMILGVNDGIISTFLLVAGVVGGGLSSTTILLTCISAALAGAFSMFAGEFMATKSQNEVMHGEINLERLHLQKYHREEIQELDGLLELIGISPTDHSHLRDQLITHYEHNFDSLLKIMVALEFGMIEDEIRSPWRAGFASGCSYAVGAMSSVLPFAVCTTPKSGLIGATVATCLALMAVGGVKTWATRGHLIKSAIENLSLASVGGVMAYGVGVFFSRVVNP